MGIQKGYYDIELVRRTKELITDYKGTHNLTLLMNALLSLVVLPNERNKIRNVKFLDIDINDVPEINQIITSPEFHFDRRRKGNNLKNLLGRIRNGIAHQRIETITEGGKWIGVVIQDIDPKTQSVG